MNIVPVSRLRAERGIDPSAEPVLRSLLADAGQLVGAGVDGANLPVVRRLLDERLAPSCGDVQCDELAPLFGGPTIVRVGPAACIVCGGSVNERARKRVLAACRRSVIRHIVVVGGSPRTREELFGDYVERGADGSRRRLGIEWRLVDGLANPSEREARANLAWADVIVLWATTQLDHKVSQAYVNGRHPRTVTCPQRSVAALCDAITRAATGDSRPTSGG